MGWRERAGKRFKIFFSPVSAFAGEKKLHCTVQNGTVQFFFFFEEKEKKFRSDSKMGYDRKYEIVKEKRVGFNA